MFFHWLTSAEGFNRGVLVGIRNLLLVNFTNNELRAGEVGGGGRGQSSAGGGGAAGQADQA